MLTVWPEWFLAKVERGDCWIWTGARTSDGYALAKVDGRFTRVHRWSYERARGDAEGVLHHVCATPLCVNPDHLALMSQSEHWRLHRNEQSESAQCPNGHPWDDENTYWYRGKYRQCRTCSRERQAARKEALRAHRRQSL